MASFAGKQYTRHRNHLNQFFGAYRPLDQTLGAENARDAVAVLRHWQEESLLAENKTDYSVCMEALQKFSELALWGTLY